ncbi:hypothetical protein LPTSP3_g31050 [Leptospira kobayashii]|uniref:SIR2-like domain protein n=1 Tax=Leptospira kobayashii TaxID=1917830 RepID=A0ABN6KMX1_9LEPT|nr:hypothetical protein [Leptospira kobayashii]BDA80175.1 hypothetical protein LPTSP3_g31050 [Leptospira kobayashii]
MKDYILYYLGAGSSANSIPVVGALSNRMSAFKGYLINSVNLDNQTFPKDSGIERTLIEIRNEFLNNIDWLIEMSGRNSIDTFARKLWDANKLKELRILKATLACYILLEQTISDTQYKSLDHRYEHWLTKITERDREEGIPFLKKNFKVISWNYDIQIEKALESISQIDLNVPVFKKWGIYPKTGRYDPNSLNSENTSIIKLNGSAGLLISTGEVYSLLTNTFKTFDKNSVINGLSVYYQYSYNTRSTQPIFTFAWEKNAMAANGVKIAKEFAKNAKELFIIGYSFPDYNKDIDIEIISEMDNLKKITLQIKNDVLEHVQDIFKSLKPTVEIKIDTEITQFKVPYL